MSWLLLLMLLYLKPGVFSGKSSPPVFQDAKDVKNFFDRAICIEGSNNLSMSSMPDNHVSLLAMAAEALKQLTHKTIIPSLSILPKNNKYSPLQEWNDVASYNKLHFEFKMVSRSGPDHKPFFTVALQIKHSISNSVLKEYTGSGSRMREAKRKAAEQALLHANYQRPPQIKKNAKNSFLSLANPQHTAPIGQTVMNFITGSGKIGGSNTLVKNTKGSVASRVLEGIKEKVFAGNKVQAGKSPISMVYEMCSRLRLQVSFIDSAERGLQHRKIFTVACQVGQYRTEGEGTKKKIAKANAAEKMVEILSNIPNNHKKVKEQQVPTSPINRIAELCACKPVYSLIQESPEFIISCQVGEKITQGSGRSKKFAKRNAALSMLKVLHLGGVPTSSNNVKTSLKKGLKILSKGIHGMPDAASFAKILLETGGNVLSNAFLQNTGKSNVDYTIESNDNLFDEMSSSIRNASLKEQMLDLAKTLKVKAEFIEYKKDDEGSFISVVWLDLDPILICHGEGPHAEEANNMAALGALQHLTRNDFLPSNGMCYPKHDDCKNPIYVNDWWIEIYVPQY